MHSNFADAWYELLQRLYNEGRPVSPRGFETRELLGIQVHVADMLKNILIHPARAISYRFMVAEWLWIATGRSDVASITKYNKHIAQFSDDGETFAGAYGPRIATQISWAIEQLQKPESRQAVLSIWTPSPSPSKDIPCTLTWQLLARDGALCAIVNMRSSDVWLGLPYDFFNFSQMTSCIAGELGLRLGSMTFNLGSSHLYDKDRAKAEAVLTSCHELRCALSPPLPCRPPSAALEAGGHVPWCDYYDVLQAPTNAAALLRLMSLGREVQSTTDKEQTN